MNNSSLPIVEGLQGWITNIQEKASQQNHEDTTNYEPKLGMEFENEAIAFDFYNEYARIKGFGVRREYKNVSKKDGVLTSRRFSCHKEGERGIDKRDYLTKEPRAETRTQFCNDTTTNNYYSYTHLLTAPFDYNSLSLSFGDLTHFQ